MRTVLTSRTEKGQRPYQEDRYAILDNEYGLVIGVFDGHGGDGTSTFCAASLSDAWDSVKDNPACPFDNDKMRCMFDYLNVRTSDMTEGTTASIVIIPKNGTEVTVGILGDSPVVIKGSDDRIVASPEHNVRSNPAEVKAAESRGGYVSGGYLFNGRGSYNGGLQMSRALGDNWLGDVLSRIPDIYNVSVDEESFVLIGTDGLFDPAHQSSPVNEIVKMVEEVGTAESLVKRALAIPTYDNVTAVLVQFLDN